MEWLDLPDDGEDIDYWYILDNCNKQFIISKVRELLKNVSNVKVISEWTIKHQKGLMKSYIEGLKELKEDAFFLSMQDFGMYVFVALTIGTDKDSLIKSVEPKPQSIQLQKELDDLYTKENVNKAIEDMGIFTTDEGKDNDGNN